MMRAQRSSADPLAAMELPLISNAPTAQNSSSSSKSTVESFKLLLAQKCDMPADQQRLIYKGHILKDDQTLLSYGLDADHIVHLVRGFAMSSANTGGPSPTRASNPTQNSRGTADSNDSWSFGGSGFGSPLFPGFSVGGLRGTGGGCGGGGGFFGAGLPDFKQVQQHLTRNPNMRDIMNMPLIQILMNNTEVMQNMMISNPQMRQIPDRNPELAHVLNDPDTLRQTLEAARNPELMREVMWNTDRAMSNI